MARCPLCGKALDWAELINQMLEKGVGEDVFKDRDKFMETFNDFVFKCPHCGEEFYGRNLPASETEKVFELLNDFKGSIDWDNKGYASGSTAFWRSIQCSRTGTGRCRRRGLSRPLSSKSLELHAHFERMITTRRCDTPKT